MAPMKPSAPPDAPFALQRLDERVFVAIEPGGGSNAGIVLGEAGPVVIDALPTPAAGAALRLAVAEITPLLPRALIYTHHHGDHTFGGQAFDCPAIAHEAAAEALRAAGPHPGRSLLLELFYGAHFARAIERARPDAAALKERFGRLDLAGLELRLPTVTFSEQLTLHDPAGAAELIYAGRAHSAGDLAVFLPKEKILFAGDLAFAGRMPFLAEPVGPGIFEALDRMEGLGPGRVVPGHGPPGGPEILRTMREFFTDLREAVRALRSQGKGLDAVKAEIALPKYADWPRYPTALPLVAEMAFLGLEADT